MADRATSARAGAGGSARARYTGGGTSGLGRRAAGPAGPVEQGGSTGPGATAADGLLQLQRDAGNQAVSALLDGIREGGGGTLAAVQREVAEPPSAVADATIAGLTGPPADIAVGFNPMDRMHRLVEAIDSAQLRMLPGQPEEQWRRHVDFPAVANALAGLTATQVAAVEQAYQVREESRGRRGPQLLRTDLFGGGENGHRSDLTHDESNRLLAMLGGTAAGFGEDPAAAAERQREADAAELHALLFGGKDRGQVERALTILRHDAEANAALAATYDRLHVTTLAHDIWYLGIADGHRAAMLLGGATATADALRIATEAGRIEAIDLRLKALDDVGSAALPTDPMALMHRRIEADRLKSERKRLVASILERVTLAADEARSMAEPTATGGEAAGAAGATGVVGDVERLAGIIGGADAAALRAIAGGDVGARLAADLRRLRADGKLTPAALTAVLRSVRDQAAAEAARRHPDGDVSAIAIDERQLADQIMDRLRAAWDEGVGADRVTFDELLRRGSGTEQILNIELAAGDGRTDDVTELALALSGDRKDLATVKRVLRDKSAGEIAALEGAYKERTFGRSLRGDLFGDAPTMAGQGTQAWALAAQMGIAQNTGKAGGSDRIELEDYFGRAEREGGLDELLVLSDRAEREYEYTIANRGGTGYWRDLWGNEARTLLDETIREVRAVRAEYAGLVAQVPGTRLAMRPEAATTPEAKALLHRMRLARATIRGDRAGYERANAQLRAFFQQVASFALQAALMAVIGPAANALFAIRGATLGARLAIWARNAASGISATIAANATVYGNDYGWAMLKRDIVTGVGGAIGTAAAEQVARVMTGPFVKGLGKRVSDEIVEVAGTYGGMEGGGLAEGKDFGADSSLESFVEQHLMGKGGKAITETVGSALGMPKEGGAAGRGEEAEEARRAAEESDARRGAAGAEAGRVPEAADVRPGAGDEAGMPVGQAPPPVSMHLPEAAEPPARRRRPAASPEASEVPSARGAEPTRESGGGAETVQNPRDRDVGYEYEIVRQTTRADDRARARVRELMPLHAEWSTLSPETRRERLATIVNEGFGLQAAGLWPVTVKRGTMQPGDASFSIERWEIEISGELLDSPDLTPELFAALADSVSHEARHALHHFRAIRAADASTTLDVNIDVKGEVLRAARMANQGAVPAEPLVVDTPAFNEALEIYQRTHGEGPEGRQGRKEIITERENRKVELEVARDRLNEVLADTSATEQDRADARRVVEEAQNRYWEAHNAYVAIPQEVDAWRMGSAVRAAAIETFPLETQLLIARAELAKAQQRLAEVDRVRQAARRPGHQPSLPIQQRYRNAEILVEATARKVRELVARAAQEAEARARR